MRFSGLKLQHQVMLFIVFATSLSFMALYGVIQHRISEDFSHFEQATTMEDLQRFKGVMDYDLKQIESLALDWAHWDQTYAFAGHQNPTFIQDNFSSATLPELDIQLAVVVDKHLKPMLAILQEGRGAPQRPLDQTELEALTAMLMEQRKHSGDLGALIKLGNQIFILASSPVTRNDHSGDPGHGFLMFGRLLDESYLKSMGKILNESIRFAATRDQAEAVMMGDENVQGIITLNDYADHPVAAIEVTNRRDILAKGRALNRDLFSLFLFLAVVIILMAYILMRFTILQRIVNLREHIQRYDKTGVFQPVKDNGRGELSDLARAFNQMMQSINETQGRLNQALLQAQNANRAKSQFLANMSHEIRTPMAAVMGYTELLESQELTSAEREEYVRILQQSGQQLLAIINDILDLSRIEAGELKLSKTPTDMRKLLLEIKAMLSDQAAKGNNKLTIHYAASAPPVLNTDPVRIQQVLVNIIGNAIKFTQNGTIDVKVCLKDGFWQLEVRDTGVGMSAEVQNRVFDSFYQHDVSHSRQYQGTGLGLTIARDLIRNLGGDIWVESTVGEGSCFTIKLPVTGSVLMSIPEKRVHVVQQFEGKVLVVDDNPVMALLMQKLLDRLGLEVETCDNAFDAIERLEQKDSEILLVFMDMQMPEMDGYQATRLIVDKKLPQPVIAVTASSMAGDEEACLAAGCKGYLSKPIDNDKLVGALARHLPIQQKP